MFLGYRDWEWGGGYRQADRRSQELGLHPVGKGKPLELQWGHDGREGAAAPLPTGIPRPIGKGLLGRSVPLMGGGPAAPSWDDRGQRYSGQEGGPLGEGMGR